MSDNTALPDFKLDHTMIRVKDLDRTLDFYTRILGMRVLRKGGRYTLAGLVYPGADITLDANDLVRGLVTLRGVHNYHPRHLVQALDFVMANQFLRFDGIDWYLCPLLTKRIERTDEVLPFELVTWLQLPANEDSGNGLATKLRELVANRRGWPEVNELPEGIPVTVEIHAKSLPVRGHTVLILVNDIVREV